MDEDAEHEHGEDHVEGDPSSTTKGMPEVTPTATRKTAFSTVSRARICVIAFLRVTIRNRPISSIDSATPIKWWLTPLRPFREARC